MFSATDSCTVTGFSVLYSTVLAELFVRLLPLYMYIHLLIMTT